MRVIIQVVFCLFTFVCLSVQRNPGLVQQPIRPSNEDDVFDPSFDTFVDDLLQELHVPGLSVAVVDDGTITSKGYGFATLPDQHATADTQYFAGSTTKAFTAAAVALLVHDNEKYPSIQWRSPLNQVIRTDFVLEDEYATSHTTLEDALSHRTGLPGHDLTLGQANETAAVVVRRMRDLPLTAEPRTQWQYCNMMYAAITHFTETVTRMDLETLLWSRFWAPLGMISTTFKIPSVKPDQSRLARGYYWHSPEHKHLTESVEGRYVPDVYLDLLTTAGDGAIISTVNDYALWIKALMNAAGDGKSWNSSSPITRSLYHDLVTPRTIVPEAEYEESPGIVAPPLYALGWITTQVGDINIVTHGGSITGFGTQVLMVPGRNFGVVTMGNTRSTSNDAGAIIISKLLVEKLNLAADRTVFDASIRQSVLKVQRAGQHALTPIRRRRNLRSSPERPNVSNERLPLPVSLFAGIYSHPGYGILNLTLSTLENTSLPHSSHEPELEALFLRTTVVKQTFKHISGTLFEVKSFEPHGLGDVITGEGIVWEEIGADYASFELGMKGDTVERAGIELEASLVDLARAKGQKYWKKGMIWFDRV